MQALAPTVFPCYVAADREVAAGVDYGRACKFDDQLPLPLGLGE